MANATKLRWIAALAGAALIATVGYAALRFGGAMPIAPVENTGKNEQGFRMSIEVPPDAAEKRAAAAAIAEDTPEGQLVLAARNGEAERVRELLAGGLSPDAEETENGHRPLHQAARAGHEEVVALLLRAGADPDSRDGSGRTALMRAARGAAVEAGRRLLDAGAEVNAQSEDRGITALMQVVSGSFFRRTSGETARPEDEAEFARMLFDRGADPNLAGAHGSPLRALVVTQNVELLDLFVDYGARADADPELAVFTMIPGPIGKALRRAMSNPDQAAPDETPADR